jgi:hypothetical protein
MKIKNYHSDPAASSTTLDKAKTNGTAMASLLAAGVGSAVLGLMIVLAEASPGFWKVILNFYDPVGPLSGKTTVATIAYFLTFGIFGILNSGKNVSEKKYLAVTFALLALGLMLTFPPI